MDNLSGCGGLQPSEFGHPFSKRPNHNSTALINYFYRRDLSVVPSRFHIPAWSIARRSANKEESISCGGVAISTIRYPTNPVARARSPGCGNLSVSVGSSLARRCDRRRASRRLECSEQILPTVKITTDNNGACGPSVSSFCFTLFASWTTARLREFHFVTCCPCFDLGHDWHARLHFVLEHYIRATLPSVKLADDRA